MKDWRERLNRILSRRGGPHETPEDELSDWRKELADFFENTVMSAFNELKDELAHHGRDVQIEKGMNHASMTVYYNGEEEFSYAIRGHAYHKMSFAFPAMGHGQGPRIAYVSVQNPGEEAEERRVKSFSKDRIIEDFLDDYARWRGW